MDKAGAGPKSWRLLNLYHYLTQNGVIEKPKAAQEFGVTLRSIQRDIEDLRCFLSNQTPPKELVYDHKLRAYRLEETSPQLLSNSEILAVYKILLESRSMVKGEMLPVLDKLISCCVPEQNKSAVSALVANEKFHYIAPHHGQRILDGLWEVGQAITRQQLIEITYIRLKEPSLVTRIVEPVGLMFSEYYFYLTAFLRNVDKESAFEYKDDIFPTIYRLDRIKTFKVLSEHFSVPYKDRFEEGEFRKRVQFMYGGKLERIKFCYTGPSIEAVLDRLPTAQATQQPDGSYIVTAEVFGKGINMWLKSQGTFVEVLDFG